MADSLLKFKLIIRSIIKHFWKYKKVVSSRILLSAPVFLTTYITWIAIDLIDTQVVNLLLKELVVL